MLWNLISDLDSGNDFECSDINPKLHHYRQPIFEKITPITRPFAYISGSSPRFLNLISDY